jgi:hypothetical protein
MMLEDQSKCYACVWSIIACKVRGPRIAQLREDVTNMMPTGTSLSRR